MKYSEQEIKEVNNLDIVEVARKLGIDMQEHKGVFMACCVDHTENTPSMQIGSRKAEYRHMTYCYACGKSHNVIGLVMRVQNCGFKEAMEWASQFTIHNSQFTSKEAVKKPKVQPKKEMKYGKMREVQQFVSLNNALSKCMRHYFPEEVVTRVTMDYLLGVDYERFHSDHTLFASIDSQDRVHNVKLQEYCTTPTSPLFCHSMKGKTKWVGIPAPSKPPRGEITATSRIEGGKQDGNEMAVGCNQPLPFGGDATTWQRGADTDCLFGEHLLKRYPEKVVALVESPKNAIVGACHMPRLLWLACGNKGMLKRELLEVLRGRDVIVYPDRDAVEEWTLKIESMRGLAHFRMADFCKDKTSPENEKMDIADLILSGPSLPVPPSR